VDDPGRGGGVGEVEVRGWSDRRKEGREGEDRGRRAEVEEGREGDGRGSEMGGREVIGRRVKV